MCFPLLQALTVIHHVQMQIWTLLEPPLRTSRLFFKASCCRELNFCLFAVFVLSRDVFLSLQGCVWVCF